MSTGGATLSEVEYAVKIITKYHKNLSLLHCSLQYPTELKDCNLGVIKTLGYAFSGLSVGYSDHTAQVSIAAVQAVYLGAKIIEKHITLGKKMHGPDHFFALEPLELKQMVKDIRKAERDFKSGNFKIDDMIFGNSVKAISPQEKYLRDFSFTRIFAGRDIRKGERITVRDLSVLRPGNKLPGLEPKYLRLFEEYRIRAKKDLAFEDPVAWDCILE
jgi:N-acetylneuraminate synthase